MYLLTLPHVIEESSASFAVVASSFLSNVFLVTEVKKGTKEESGKESDIEETTELAEVDLAHTSYESDSQTSLTSESLKSNVRMLIF